MSQSLICPAFLFHASMHITFPCFSWLWALFTTLFAVGAYATTTSSGVSGMMLAHHLLIYFLRSRHILSFSIMLFPSGELGACSSPCPGSVSGENKTLTCEGSDLPALHLQPRLHLLKSSAISLFLSSTPRQTSCQQTLISLGTKCIRSYGKRFSRVFVRTTNRWQGIIWGA